MKRKFYVKPNTRLFSVELEETFAGSAEVHNPKGHGIESQSINTAWDSNNFGNEGTLDDVTSGGYWE